MKRSGPLARTAPLVRKTRLRPRSKTKKYARRFRDRDFMAFVAKQPCHLAHTGKCYGRVQVDHAGNHAFGQRSPDNETIPLCRRHHQQRTDYRGYFKDFNATSMQEWRLRAVHFYRELYARLVELRQTPWRCMERKA
jgi:hypothetical protein